MDHDKLKYIRHPESRPKEPPASSLRERKTSANHQSMWSEHHFTYFLSRRTVCAFDASASLIFNVQAIEDTDTSHSDIHTNPLMHSVRYISWWMCAWCMDDQPTKMKKINKCKRTNTALLFQWIEWLLRPFNAVTITTQRMHCKFTIHSVRVCGYALHSKGEKKLFRSFLHLHIIQYIWMAHRCVSFLKTKNRYM